MKPPNSRSISPANAIVVQVIQVAANDLDANWQAAFVMSDWGDRRWQASQRSDSGPCDLVVVRNLLAINVELPRPNK